MNTQKIMQMRKREWRRMWPGMKFAPLQATDAWFVARRIWDHVQPADWLTDWGSNVNILPRLYTRDQQLLP
jgi:hypothetical protein